MHLPQIAQIAEEHCFLIKRFLERQGDLLIKAADRITRALQNGGKVVLFGNGGSAADAQHIAAEFVGRFSHDRPGIPAIALTTDGSTMTSIANDYGYEFLFARQIEALCKKEDLALAISTSGQSRNVLEGLRAARDKEVETLALLGRDGGAARELADLSLVVSADKTPRIQEVHQFIGHVLCESVEQRLFRRRD